MKPAPAAHLPHLVARLDATHESGMAHAIRVDAILREIARPFSLTVIGRGEPLAQFFPDATRLDPDAVQAGQPWESGLAALRPDLLLIDLPRALAVRWDGLRAAYHGKIALIDDWGGAVDADLIINGTVLDAYHHYPAARAGATILTGPRHALLRPAFQRCRWREPARENLVVVVGGGERAADWAGFLARQMPWPDMPATLVVGAAFPRLAELAALAASEKFTLRVGLSGDELARLLAQASLALTTGGMIVYECLALGTPLLFFPQLHDLLPEAEWFAARGVGRSLGYEGGFDAEWVRAEVAALLTDAAERQAMSKRQRALIDGLGASRAAAAIEDLLDLAEAGARA